MADKVVEIKEAVGGGLDLDDLKAQLKKYEAATVKIGTFSAASNVTGQMLDVESIASILHEAGAISCWDYAAAASHIKIDMNPTNQKAYKDAVVLSPHKFLGESLRETCGSNNSDSFIHE